MEIKLTQGKSAIIDDCDYLKVSTLKWQAQQRSDKKGWYAVSKGGVRMHRFIMGVTDKSIVDHKDGDGLNNSRSNLRIGDQSKNSVNRKITNGKYLRGVTKKGNRFRSMIKLNKKMVHLGYYSTEEEAHNRYLQESIMHHGEWQPLPHPQQSK